MKRYVRSALALLTAVLLLLSGCTEQTDGAGAMGSQVWETMPQLTYGQMAYEKLEVLDWNCGRLEATSCETMAETESGYYLVYMNYLFYADKDDLSNWVPVCSKPDCKHTANERCVSNVLSERIIVKDGRLFGLAKSGIYPEIYDGKEAIVVISMAANGTDMRLEYVLEEGTFSTDAGIAAFLYSDQLLYNAKELMPDGTTMGHLFRVTDAGVEKVATVENFTQQLVASTPTNIVYGVHLFSTTLLDGAGRMFYYYQEDTLYPLDITTLPAVGGYLSGQTLRYFRANDGYYDSNRETGELLWLAAARMENSRGKLLLPNCIIESTLFAGSGAGEGAASQAHEMELFDGSQWRAVELPKELQTPDDNLSFSVMGVSSDCVLIACSDSRTSTAQYGFSFGIYRIPLGTESLKAEFCGSVKIPAG